MPIYRITYLATHYAPFLYAKPYTYIPSLSLSLLPNQIFDTCTAREQQQHSKDRLRDSGVDLMMAMGLDLGDVRCSSAWTKTRRRWWVRKRNGKILK
ncbi:hypothetical protein GLOTRDRAFT_110619 [Gloeophyllum trabeum ATCC 11539]|uniref:Uncharacterized protein n=1 Tax=Gloeophyllum trabeum (strain ATCC 11539 / FP-39264 / Madison 617) TaxID=670483 RepID=S7QCD1_GLOTA|nr:uncharacterized protein GLOTRDRAFT_110619 [Gloeophyllum trabeum ATCC 11539]EPQ57541.1 hypothetical protein GLOTRDRAFT_110619 [Gloeophyllum trabeum ATCC 11539]